jgi:hypothetical protein
MQCNGVDILRVHKKAGSQVLVMEMRAAEEDNSGIDGIEVVAMTENKSYATFEIMMQCILLIASVIIFYSYAFGVKNFALATIGKQL